MKNRRTKIDTSLKPQLVALASVLAVVLSLFASYAFVAWKYLTPSDATEFSNMFAGWSAFASTVAIVAVIYTLIQQQRSLVIPFDLEKLQSKPIFECVEFECEPPVANMGRFVIQLKNWGGVATGIMLQLDGEGRRSLDRCNVLGPDSVATFQFLAEPGSFEGMLTCRDRLNEIYVFPFRVTLREKRKTCLFEIDPIGSPQLPDDRSWSVWSSQEKPLLPRK